jgi:hypothetical protein
MAASPTSRSRVLSALKELGPSSPGTLMAQLVLSQPTVYRAAQSQSEQILSFGGKRNRKLAAIRNVRGLNSKTPVFTVSQEGEVEPVGDVIALYPHAFALVVDDPEATPRLYPGLPSFLNDARPRGFLGAAFARKHPELKFPPRAEDWNADHVLEVIARRGEDLSGNVLVGSESFERLQVLHHTPPELVSPDEPAARYEQYAEEAMKGNPRGTALAGDQPKFGAILGTAPPDARHVMVKFSPLGNGFAARRGRDLLICEALTLEALKEFGLDTAEARVIDGGDRLFLELTRFDRVGLRGRKRLLSLAALDAGRTTNARTTWPITATMLEHEGRISDDDLSRIRELECFARMIGNEDRTPDNLSFLWRRGDPMASLAPAYDMVPTLYAPNANGEDTHREFTMPTFDPSLMHAWRTMQPAALRFWERVLEDARISPEFKVIAAWNRKVLQQKGL